MHRGRRDESDQREGQPDDAEPGPIHASAITVVMIAADASTIPICTAPEAIS